MSKVRSLVESAIAGLEGEYKEEYDRLVSGGAIEIIEMDWDDGVQGAGEDDIGPSEVGDTGSSTYEASTDDTGSSTYEASTDDTGVSTEDINVPSDNNTTNVSGGTLNDYTVKANTQGALSLSAYTKATN